VQIDKLPAHFDDGIFDELAALFFNTTGDLRENRVRRPKTDFQREA
jgi:hypothetical protein